MKSTISTVLFIFLYTPVNNSLAPAHNAKVKRTVTTKVTPTMVRPTTAKPTTVKPTIPKIGQVRLRTSQNVQDHPEMSKNVQERPTKVTSTMVTPVFARQNVAATLRLQADKCHTFTNVKIPKWDPAFKTTSLRKAKTETPEMYRNVLCIAP